MHCSLTQVLEVEEEVAIVGPHPVACTAEVVAVFTGVSGNAYTQRRLRTLLQLETRTDLAVVHPLCHPAAAWDVHCASSLSTSGPTDELPAPQAPSKSPTRLATIGILIHHTLHCPATRAKSEVRAKHARHFTRAAALLHF